VIAVFNQHELGIPVSDPKNNSPGRYLFHVLPSRNRLPILYQKKRSFGGEELVQLWSTKRYHTWNWHLRQEFAEKVAKIPLDAGFSCPNRTADGSGGCIYCSPRGSGDCAGDRIEDIAAQYIQIKNRTKKKWPRVNKFLAYFQAYTNTQAPVQELEQLYRQAIGLDGVVGISISTRPDCLSDPVVDLLAQLSQETWLWVELGLQSAHDGTLKMINRGHDYACFLDGVQKLHERNIRVCAHIILGLPGETDMMMLETARRLAALPLQGIKIHLLHVVRHTQLAQMWKQGLVPLPDMKSYAHRVVNVLEVLPPEMVVHRVTGDAPREILLAPLWSWRKWEVLMAIDRALEERDTWQGRLFDPSWKPNNNG
jgi:radical SAM protein (TIGR01212 family)